MLLRYPDEIDLKRHGTDEANRQIQLDAEAVWYADAPNGWSVLTLFYLVAPST